MKRTALVLLTLALIFSISACATTGKPTETAAATAMAAPTSTQKSDAATPTPEPPEEITVKMLFPQNSGLRPSMDTTKVWDYIRENTGITFELTILEDSQQLGLMFASRTYPDMMASVGATDMQLQTAAEAGDLVDLGPLLDQYAPTWKAFLDANPLVYNSCTLNDGKLYSLPFINHDPYDRDLRDQWLYIYPWLEELKLEVPTTTEDFKSVLLAIKNAAGTGSIPADVIPYYYLFDSYVGGQFDIYGSFGIPVTSGEYLSVEEDGTVVCQAVNPDLKEPLKYLQELYKAGVTPPECFTDDWNAYLSKISGNPPLTFSYTSYANRLPDMTYPMGPLDSGNGKAPMIRRQAYIANSKYATTIFSVCEHPEAVVKFYEWAAQYENAMTVAYGLQGVVWDYTGDGLMTLNFWESNQAKMNEESESVGLWNSWFALLPRDLFANRFYNANKDVKGTREWGFENIYKNCLVPDYSVYVGGTLDADSTAIMDQFATDLNAYRKQTFANWITTGADIDAQWDAYVAQMNTLGLEDWLAYKQDAYDILMK